MTVTLNLKPELEAQITRKAVAEGVALPEYIERVIQETLKPEPRVIYSEEQLAKNQATLAMLREWREEDKRMSL